MFFVSNMHKLVSLLNNSVKMHETRCVIKSEDRLFNKESNIPSSARVALHHLSTQMHVTVFSPHDAVSVCKLFLNYILSNHVL